MAELTRLTDDSTLGDESLFEAASRLIDEGRRVAASSVNAALTMTYWHLGRLINGEVVSRRRAEYGKQIVVSLAQQLTARFGSGFHKTNLSRMMAFARLYPDEQIVVSLAQQLSWTHIYTLLPLKSEQAREFYAAQVVDGHLSVRELRGVIERKAFERREIANSQVATGSAVPLDTFSDPYLLSFLGMEDGYQEHDLEAAIIKEIERFLLELGTGFTFVARQKRMTVGADDFYLDLLLFHRKLRRLVAVELKIGKFKPSHKGQMELYLKWLDRYERQEGEEAPIGLILCAEADRDQVELLELNKDGIVVAEYWPQLLPKKQLEQRLRMILRDAQERVARRAIQQNAH